MSLHLRPLQADDLPAVDVWFEDEESRRWLGGPGWAAIGLGLAGPGRHALLGLLNAVPVGLADIEIEAGRRASFAIAVSPQARRRRIGSMMIDAIVAGPWLDGVHELYAGVETGNLASRRLLEAAGFSRVSEEDADGFVTYARVLESRSG